MNMLDFSSALRGVRWAVLALVVTAAIGIAAGASAGVTAGSAAKPSQAAIAKRLASNLARARTPAARKRSLLEIMRALHFGVFSPGGKAIVRGGKPSAVHLYDFEIKSMASALARRESSPVSQVAARLNAAGIKPGGAELSGDVLAARLAAGTRSALAHPRDRLSLVPLLVRELGLRQARRYDLASAQPDQIRLDGLQSVLIGADVASAALRMHPALKAASSGGPCSNQAADAVKEVMPFGKWGLGLIKAVAGPLKVAAITLDAIHGPALAYSVQVRPLSTGVQTTHYGPAGHNAGAGNVLRLRMLVEMLDDYGDFVVKCGPLVGMKFPKRGGIPGVKILWDQALGNLEPHGTIAYEPADGKTGPDGVATLVFTPKSETFVNFGIDQDARGLVSGVALYQSAFGNVPGSLAQFLFTKAADMPWQVTFHQPRGFRADLSLPGVILVPTQSFVDDFTFTLRVCGSDPYAAPWQLTARDLIRRGGVTWFDYNEEQELRFQRGASTRATFARWLASAWDFSLVEEQRTIVARSPTFPSVTVTGQLQDDLTCPAGSG
jgi:hypothetical protein